MVSGHDINLSLPAEVTERDEDGVPVPSVQEQLDDAQKQVGRLEFELATLKAGLGCELRWTKTPPLMSGVYLNGDYCDFEPGNVIDKQHWQVVPVFEGGTMMYLRELGPLWAGPLKVEAPR